VGVDEDVVAWRRYLHRHLEVSFEEHETSAWIADKLASFGLQVERPRRRRLAAHFRTSDL
jgi:amidohydrolase